MCTRTYEAFYESTHQDVSIDLPDVCDEPVLAVPIVQVDREVPLLCPGDPEGHNGGVRGLTRWSRHACACSEENGQLAKYDAACELVTHLLVGSTHLGGLVLSPHAAGRSPAQLLLQNSGFF